MTISGEHPFLPPERERSPVRRFRGRLASGVTLWTTAYGEQRAGLTVSSMLVADGEPARMLALLDPDSDLWETAQRSRTVAVSLLGWDDRQLADAFAGLAPAPGGAFRLASWQDTEWGPVLEPTSGWAGGRLADAQPREVGWALLAEVLLEHLAIGDEPEESVLIHRRGRYHHL